MRSAGNSIGDISPINGVAFLLAALSYLTAPTMFAGKFRSGTAALAFAALLSFMGLFFYWPTSSACPSSTALPTPPALLTCLRILALGAALILRALPHLEILHGRPESEVRAGFAYLGAFALFSSAILIVSLIHFRNFEAGHRIDVDRQLTAIAELKAHQLVAYRHERLADAIMLLNTPGFPDLVSRAFKGPEGSPADHQLQSWMERLASLEHYELVWLLDERGHLRRSALTKGAVLIQRRSRASPKCCDREKPDSRTSTRAPSNNLAWP